MSGIKKENYEYSENDVFIFKLISGEEIIALLHYSENIAVGKPEPVCTIQNPLKFNINNGEMTAEVWCPWAIDRVFAFSSQNIMFAVPATANLAEHYFKEQFPEKTEVVEETKPGIILPDHLRTDEEKVRAAKNLNSVSDLSKFRDEKSKTK